MSNQWLTFAQAAEILGVTDRTIKRWVSNPRTCVALLAVRVGKQHRIPRPESIAEWDGKTRGRLTAAGISLAPAWEKELRDLERRNERHWSGIYRLYLAAFLKASLRGRITFKAKEAIDSLCFTALESLRSRKRFCRVDTLKCALPQRFWRYWPTKRHFKQIQDVHRRRTIEKERQLLDFLAAVRILRRRNRKPIARNLCPLLHLDWETHINDTKERLPSGSGRAQKPKDLCPTSPGQKPALGFIDMRQPQDGISLDQFRRRYPLRKNPWRSIIAKQYGYLDNIPTAE